MEMYSMMLGFVLYGFSMYVDLRFVNLMLKHKADPSVRPSIIYMAAGIFNWLVAYYCTISWMVTISAVIAILFIVVVIYDGNIFSKLAVALIVVAVSVGTENIVWGILLRANMEPGPAGNLISSLGRLTIIVVLERYVKSGKQTRLPLGMPIGSFLNMMLISVGGIALSNILVQAELKDQFTMAGLFIVIVINISTYHLYVKINEVCSREIEQITMQQQILRYQNQFHLMEQSEEKIRLFRHDMKKHMLMLIQYMKKGSYENALEYAEQILQNVNVSEEYVRTGNNGIDCIVNHMLARADQPGCEKNIVIQVPKTCFMPDLDLNMLLGNLFENALEAIEKAEQKKLDLFISYKKGVLYVSLYNTYNGSVRKKGEEYATTKPDRTRHGLGMRSIRYIVEKYHGEMKVQNFKEWFQVDIMIYIDAV